MLTQSQRTGFPAELERQVVDGGVREGRPETGHAIGLVWLFVFLVVFLVAVGLFLNWRIFFP